MKYELEIPDLPEGIKPVGTLGVKPGELAYLDGEVVRSVCNDGSLVKLELLPGYKAVGEGYPITILRMPRKRVRIEFDMPEGYSGVRAVPFSVHDDYTGWVTGAELAVSILPEGK